MFVCVSPNPAIDKRLRVPHLTLGSVNRATETRPSPGGKAAHVAMVLQALHADPLWFGFAGGASGEALLSGLRELGIRVHASPIQQPTRVNLEIIESNGAVTEILEPGPAISETEIQAFQDAFDDLFKDGKNGAQVIFSGSLPPGVEKEFYATIIRRGHSHGCQVFLDTSGEPLRAALKEKPHFVKPNREEAEWFIGSAIADLPSAAAAARCFLAEGAQSAAISLGKDGLVWAPGGRQEIYYAQAPAVEKRSAVGSGDAAVAAFAYSISRGLAPEETVRLAAACGAANCLAESPGLVEAADVCRLQNEIRVEAI